MRAAKAQASLRICVASLEPSLLADAISTEILCTGPYESKRVQISSRRQGKDYQTPSCGRGVVSGLCPYPHHRVRDRRSIHVSSC